MLPIPMTNYRYKRRAREGFMARSTASRSFYNRHVAPFSLWGCFPMHAGSMDTHPPRLVFFLCKRTDCYARAVCSPSTIAGIQCGGGRDRVSQARFPEVAAAARRVDSREMVRRRRASKRYALLFCEWEEECACAYLCVHISPFLSP